MHVESCARRCAHDIRDLTGQSGTGRTTFINTLCGQDVLQHKEPKSAEFAHEEEPIKIRPVNVGARAQTPHLGFACRLTSCCMAEMEEDGIRISLTVVDTPGFGDQIDNEPKYAPRCEPCPGQALTWGPQLCRDPGLH